MLSMAILETTLEYLASCGLFIQFGDIWRNLYAMDKKKICLLYVIYNIMVSKHLKKWPNF